MVRSVVFPHLHSSWPSPPQAVTSASSVGRPITFSRRREFCYSAEAPSPSLLRRLLKGRGGCGRMAGSSMAEHLRLTLPHGEERHSRLTVGKTVILLHPLFLQ